MSTYHDEYVDDSIIFGGNMNWSLLLNAVLLIGVVVAIVRTIQTRRQQETKKTVRNPASNYTPQTVSDDIIAIRKVGFSHQNGTPIIKPSVNLSSLRQPDNEENKPQIKPNIPVQNVEESPAPEEQKAPAPQVNTMRENETIMIFLLAKSDRQLAGYELLQAVLSAGFRFGEGGLFHRHQHPNCQGPVMCSLAAATPTGVFDLQNMGAFVVHGLCLFMQVSGYKEIDAERFDVMLDAARNLSDSLDTYLLDDLREPLSEQSIQRYYQKLMLIEEQVCAE